MLGDILGYFLHAARGAGHDHVPGVTLVVVAARGAPRRTAIAASGECDAVRFIRRGVLRKHLAGRVVERRRRSDEAHGVVAVAGRADVVYPPVVGIAAASARARLLEKHRPPPKREPPRRPEPETR